MRLNVNTDAVVTFSNNLEKISRGALPYAVRTTLNSAAFDMKKTSIERSTSEKFIKRKKNFFKATSRVEKAMGWDINKMASMVGFRGSDQAIENLEQQEGGGKIAGRSYIPALPARISKSIRKSVRANARLAAIKKIADYRNAPGVNDRQKFIKSVFHAGKGGHVLGNYKGKHILWRVNSLKRNDFGGFKLMPIYNYQTGRSVQVGASHFMDRAASYTAPKLERFFIENAKRRIERDLK